MSFAQTVEDHGFESTAFAFDAGFGAGKAYAEAVGELLLGEAFELGQNQGFVVRVRKTLDHGAEGGFEAFNFRIRFGKVGRDGFGKLNGLFAGAVVDDDGVAGDEEEPALEFGRVFQLPEFATNADEDLRENVLSGGRVRHTRPAELTQPDRKFVPDGFERWLQEDFGEVFRRYVPRSEGEGL